MIFFIKFTFNQSQEHYQEELFGSKYYNRDKDEIDFI